MTQQSNWQQGVWGDSNAANAYQQTYNAPQGAQAPAGGAAAYTGQPHAAQAQPSPQQPVQPQSQPQVQAPQQPQQPQAQTQAPQWPQAQPSQQPASGQAPAPSPEPNPNTNPYCAHCPYEPVSGQPAYAGAPSAPAPKKSRGWIVALVAVVLFFALMLFGMASCNAAISSVAAPFGSMAEDATGGLVSSNSVGIIEMGGTIQYDGSTCSPEGLKDQLDAAEENPYIKAVVLRIDSGGGVATAGEEMSTYVREFSKPIVVSSASVNASAAYEISSQTDYIFTASTTAIGAIGTAMQVTDMSGLLDKLGIGVDNLVSSDSKDSSYGTRPLTEEERAYYQRQIDQIDELFIENVARGRGMTVSEVRALATGLTFTGVDAVENGLADEIGTLEDAIEKAVELAGCANCDVVYLQPYSDDLSELLSLVGAQSKSSLMDGLKEWESNVRFEG